MKLVPYTYNGTAINDGTNYTSVLSVHNAYRGVGAEWSERSWTDAKLSGKKFTGTTLKLIIKVVGGSVDTLSRLFDKYDTTPRILICKDPNDSDRQWYIKGYAIGFEISANVNVVTLAVDEPAEWQTVTTNSDAWGISATGATHTFSPTIIGNRPAKPTFTITPLVARGTASTGYLYCMNVPIYHTSTNHAPNYPVLLTQNGTVNVWAHNTEVGAGRSQADGDDIRVMVDGYNVNYWATGLNSASCKIWCNLDFEPSQTMTLGANMGTATITTFTVAQTKANQDAMKALPAIVGGDDPVAGNSIFSTYAQLLIGSELFIVTTVNPYTWTFSGVTRAANDTTAAAHTAGDSIYWIQHDVKICYGDTTATAPTIDNTKKPIIDLTNSTNSSWVYTEFASSDFKRTGGWRPAVTSSLGKTSNYYTGSHGALASPATEMGMTVKAYQVGSRWCAENAVVLWRFYHPFGITAVTSTGAKYRSGADWATGYCGIEKYDGGVNWTMVDSEATPGTAGVWGTFTHTASSLSGTFNFIYTILQSALSGTSNNMIALEYQGMTLALTNVPTVSMSSRIDAYEMNVKLSNNVSGENIQFTLPTGLNKQITINCSDMTANYSDGRVIGINTSTKRHDWLNCGPGSCSLQWDETGVAGGTCVITWKDRNL